MICKRCGSKLGDRAKFCPVCGWEVEEVTQRLYLPEDDEGEEETRPLRQDKPMGITKRLTEEAPPQQPLHGARRLSEEAPPPPQKVRMHPDAPVKKSSKKKLVPVLIIVLIMAFVLGAVSIVGRILEKRAIYLAEMNEYEGPPEEFPPAESSQAPTEESSVAPTKEESSEASQNVEESSVPQETVVAEDKPLYEGADVLPLTPREARLCAQIIEDTLKDSDQKREGRDPAYEVNKHLVYAALMDYNGDGALDLCLNYMYTLKYDTEDPTDSANTPSAQYLQSHPGEDVAGRFEIWDLGEEDPLFDSYDYSLPFESLDGYGDQPGLFLEIVDGKVQISEYHFNHEEGRPQRSLIVFNYDENKDKQYLLYADIVPDGYDTNEFHGQINDYAQDLTRTFEAGTVHYVDDNYFSPIQGDGEGGLIDLFAGIDKKVQEQSCVLLFWGKHASFRQSTNDTEAFVKSIQDLAKQQGSEPEESSTTTEQPSEPAGNQADERIEEITRIVLADDGEENEKGWRRVDKKMRYAVRVPSSDADDHEYLLLVYTYQASSSDPRFLFWYDEYQGKDVGLMMEIWDISAEVDDALFVQDCEFTPTYTDQFRIPYCYLDLQGDEPALYLVFITSELGGSGVDIQTYPLDESGIELGHEVYIWYGHEDAKYDEDDPLLLVGAVWDKEDGTVLQYSRNDDTEVWLEDVREVRQDGDPDYGKTPDTLITIPYREIDDALLEAFSDYFGRVVASSDLIWHGGWYGQFDPGYETRTLDR